VPNYASKPILNDCDEEYLMLIEVTEEFEKQKMNKITREKYGSPTEIILRNHLLSKKLNISSIAGVTIEGSKIKNGLLFLKNLVDPNQTMYLPDQVKMVIEAKNNAVGGKTLENGKREDANKGLRAKFNELEATAGVGNFAVVVLSETLLPPGGPYKWRFKEEAIGKQNCKVFTLVARELYPPGGLYVKSSIEEMLRKGHMRKTGEFQRLINYLKCL
jgi:hypothetical protein